MNKYNIIVSNKTVYTFIACLYYVSLILSSSNILISIQIFLSIVRYISFFTLLVLFFIQNQKIYIKNALIILISIILVLVVYININDAAMIVTLMFILAGKNIDMDYLTSKMYKTGFVLLIVIICFSFLGLIPTISEIRTNNTYRYSFGFVGANAMSTVVFVNLTYYLYANRKYFNSKNRIFYFIISLLTYFFTNSRMVLLLEILMILFLIGASKYKKIQKIIYEVSTHIYTIMVIITFSLVEWYSRGSYTEPLRNKVNLLTTGRLYWASYFKQEYGYTFWGQYVHFVGVKMAKEQQERWQVIDNAYEMLAIHYGIIIIILFIIAYYFLAHNLKKNSDYLGCIFIIIMSLWGLTEYTTIQPGFNITIFFIAMLVSGELNKPIRKHVNKGETSYVEIHNPEASKKSNA